MSNLKSQITHYFIPIDEFEGNDMLGHIGPLLAGALLGMAHLEPIADLLHALSETAEMHDGLAIPRPAPLIIQRLTQAAWANGSLAATPLGDRRGIWVPIEWNPEPAPEAITTRAKTWAECELERREQNRSFAERARTYTPPKNTPAPEPQPHRRYATPFDRLFHLPRKPKPIWA